MKKKCGILFAVVVAVSLMMVPAALVGANPGPGIVGLWHLDEGSGTTAYDSSGNNNDGTIQEAGWTDGKFDKALSFDGTDDYVDFGSDASLQLTDELTIEFWVKRTDNTTFERFLSHSTDASNYAYEVGVDFLEPHKWRLRLNSDDATLKVTMVGEAGQWIHVAFVYDKNLTSDNMKIYENGVLVASEHYSKPLTGHGTLRTNRQGKNDGWLKSTIDEVHIWDEALTASEIATLASSYDPEVVGLWHLDGNAFDSSGYGNDGIAYGDVGYVSGVSGSALSFDGSGDYVSVPDSASLRITGELTIEAWVNETTRGQHAKIVSRRSGNYFYFLGVDNGKPYGGIGDGSMYTVTTKTVAMPTGEWHHLTFVYDDMADEMYLYYDGVLEETVVVTESLPSQIGVKLSIGADFEGTSNYFTGTIDEVRTWKRALSAEEVAALVMTPMSMFEIDHATINFKNPDDDDKVRVKGRLELDLFNGDNVSISEDVIVTVGTLSEIITMVEKDGKWEYKRPETGGYIIKKMKIDWKKGKFEFSMDKVDLSGLTDPNDVTISIRIGDDFGWKTISMKEKKHWDYKAPHH